MLLTPVTGLRGVHVTSLSAGIDWVTWVEKDPLGQTYLMQVGEQLVQQEADEGAKVTGFHAEGYHGWKASRVSIGSRQDSSLLRISGGAAAMHWGLLRGLRGRPSRLDVQASLTLDTARKDLGSHILRRRTSHRPQSGGRPPKVTTWSDSEGSFCGMVGSRTSRKYLRVYDKGVEQKSHAPGLHWRVELEAKRDLSGALWSQLTKAQDAAAWCLKCCESSVRSSGRVWPLPPSTGLPVLPPVEQREPPEVERTKRWLRNMVAPAVGRLIGAVGTTELLELLGLDAYAIPLTELSTQERSSWHGRQLPA
jgi:hypothetical protein